MKRKFLRAMDRLLPKLYHLEVRVKAEDIINRIRESLPSAEIKAYDMTGGGDHWQLTIKAQEFQGLNLVEQHQLIYRTLGEWMDGPIHALSLNTRAPD